ncbi:MAG: LptF/LptG family permease [Akkermansiaceae bacterium]|jgi:lipopolysaccharide export system permease protein|nr:LptF/LptG family permease [Akkermansiaceae bacterium]
MRISDRYIGRDIISGTLFAILLLSLLLVLGNVFKQIRPLLVEFGAPLSVMVDFMLSVLPVSLIFTIPWGFLSAVLLVFGRLSSDNELSAFRSAGMSLTRIAAPVIVIGAGLSLVCLWLNLEVSPKATRGVQEIVRETIIRDPRTLLRAGVDQSRFSNVRVYSASDDGEVFKNFHVFLMGGDEDGPGGSYVHAETATTVNDEQKREIRLRFTDAFIDSSRPAKRDQAATNGTAANGREDFSLLSRELQWMVIDYSNDARSTKLNPGALNNAELDRVISEYPPLGPTPPGIVLSEQQLKSRAIDEAIRTQVRTRCRVEQTRRYTSSFACLAFALIGVPLGIKAKRRDTSSGLILSLLIGAAYFAAGMLISPSEHQTSLLWVPNIVCILLGLFLFRRARFR